MKAAGYYFSPPNFLSCSETLINSHSCWMLINRNSAAITRHTIIVWVSRGYTSTQSFLHFQIMSCQKFHLLCLQDPVGGAVYTKHTRSTSTTNHCFKEVPKHIRLTIFSLVLGLWHSLRERWQSDRKLKGWLMMIPCTTVFNFLIFKAVPRYKFLLKKQVSHL